MVAEIEDVKKRQAKTRLVTQKMKRILVHFRSQMDEKLRPRGVTTAQLQVLKAIQTEPGMSGAQLARFCYVTPQSAQALLKGLEDDGWIIRSKDAANERILTAVLTSAGKKLMVTAERDAKVIEARLWKGVGEDSIDQLNDLLEQCLVNLDPEPDDR
jgi:MarR family transcriptional regulator, organic hydroperoxide resistance regulator